MATPMMKCGHAANATHGDAPACAICFSITPAALVVADTPDLTGRTARCSCGAQEPSSTNLAFFEYRGPGSADAVLMCGTCRYHLIAHEREIRERPHNSLVCHDFTPRGPADTDGFYCGHAGWD